MNRSTTTTRPNVSRKAGIALIAGFLLSAVAAPAFARGGGGGGEGGNGGGDGSVMKVAAVNIQNKVPPKPKKKLRLMSTCGGVTATSVQGCGIEY